MVPLDSPPPPQARQGSEDASARTEVSGTHHEVTTHETSLLKKIYTLTQLKCWEPSQAALNENWVSRSGKLSAYAFSPLTCDRCSHYLLQNERKETGFKELSVLGEEFSGAHILMCHFRVNCLQEEAAKETYNLDAYTKKEMKRAMQLLGNAPSEKNYDEAISTVKAELRTEAKKCGSGL
eukprot:jgi/Phyca11/19310/fgenesh1_pg.PHYCAscaffold_47_\